MEGIKIYRSFQIRAIESYTMSKSGISEDDLMEVAAMEFSLRLMMDYQRMKRMVVFAGPGNNGGDALAISRLYWDKVKEIDVYLCRFKHRLSACCSLNLERLQGLDCGSRCVVHIIDTVDDLPKSSDFAHEGTVCIDGLFGIGINRPVVGDYAAAIGVINGFSEVVSIDVPSGLMTESVHKDGVGAIVKAKRTYTFSYPKLSFFFGSNERYVGRFKVLDIDLEAPEGMVPLAELTDGESVLSRLCSPLPRFGHKGTFGHALLIAGSEGMAGAALLASRACMRCGVGKLTVMTPESNRVIMQLGVPEAIVYTYPSGVMKLPSDLSVYDAIAIGPGIGTSDESVRIVSELLSRYKGKLVIDADALNIIGSHRELLDDLPAGTVLTPHKREFSRLTNVFDYEDDELGGMMEFCRKYGVNMVLKGAYSKVFADGKLYVNPSGNPGMGTAGSGDVLTGIILGLAASGSEMGEALRDGVYVHGWAGDKAAESVGERGLTASDIVLSLKFKIWLRRICSRST